MRARLASELAEVLVVLLCYLVLSLCGWAIDHGLTDVAPTEPAA